MANRYTNLTPATFNPLSVQEIMMVPLARQQMHDDFVTKSEEMGVFDVNRLNVDDKLVQEGIDGFKTKLTSIQDQLFQKGADKSMTREFIKLKREKDAFLSNDGIGGRAQNALKGYQEDVKNIRANKNMSATDQGEAINYARRRYEEAGGVAKQANYESYGGFDTVDLNEKMIEYGKNLEPQILKTSGWYKDPEDPTLWRNGSQKTTKLPLHVIQEALAKTATSDRGIMEYLQEKQRVNPNFNPQEALLRSINGVSSLFVKNDIEIDRDIKFDTRKPAAGDIGNGSQVAFDSFIAAIPSETVEFKNESLDIMAGVKKKESLSKDISLGKSGIVQGFGGMSTMPAQQDVREISAKEKAQIMENGQWVLKQNGINEKFDPSNTMHRNLMKKEYELTSKYKGNMSINLIRPFVKDLGNGAQGIDRPRQQDFTDEVNQSFISGNRGFIANGKYYSSRKLLLKALGLDPAEVKKVNSVFGITDWDNQLHKNLPKGAEHFAKDFIENVAFTLTNSANDDVKVYMSGGDGDVSSTPYEKKAKETLWENVGKMKDMPRKPVEMNIGVREGGSLKEQKAKISWVPKEMSGVTQEMFDAMDPADRNAFAEEGLGVYKVEHLDGDIEYFSKKNLQDNIYTLEKARYGKGN